MFGRSCIDAPLLTSGLIVGHKLLIEFFLPVGAFGIKVALISCHLCIGIILRNDTSACVESFHLAYLHGSRRDGQLATDIAQLTDSDLTEVGCTTDGDIVGLHVRHALVIHSDDSTRRIGLIVSKCGRCAIAAQLSITLYRESEQGSEAILCDAPQLFCSEDDALEKGDNAVGRIIILFGQKMAYTKLPHKLRSNHFFG